MGNKPILPSHGTHKTDEDAVKKEAHTAVKIADRIKLSFRTAYFKAVETIIETEDKGLSLEHKVSAKNNQRKKNRKNPTNSPKK